MGTPHGPDGADGQPEVDDEESSADDSSVSSAPAPSNTRRRLLVFGLIAAAVLGVAEYATKLPSKRDVVVRVGDGIDRVELVWHEGDAVVHRTELGPPFNNPKSPVHLSDGTHRLELSVQRGADVTHEERRIEVADGASEIVIEVR